MNRSWEVVLGEQVVVDEMRWFQAGLYVQLMVLTSFTSASLACQPLLFGV